MWSWLSRLIETCLLFCGDSFSGSGDPCGPDGHARVRRQNFIEAGRSPNRHGCSERSSR